MRPALARNQANEDWQTFLPFEGKQGSQKGVKIFDTINTVMKTKAKVDCKTLK